MYRKHTAGWRMVGVPLISLRWALTLADLAEKTSFLDIFTLSLFTYPPSDRIYYAIERTTPSQFTTIYTISQPASDRPGLANN